MEPRRRSGRPRLLRLPEQVEALREHLQVEPDLGLSERCEHLAKSEGVRVSEPTLWRALRALGWTRKKDARRQRTRPGRTRGLALASDAAFTGARPGVRGRERVQPGAVPALRLRTQRGTLSRASAPQPWAQHLDPRGDEPGGTGRHHDRGRLHQQRSVPDLFGKRALPRVAPRPDRCHGQPRRPQKRGRARKDRSLRLPPVVLPAYSPDFNPIEHAFAKLKQSLRKAKARTQETLEAAIAAALATITSHDARGWFKHCEFPLPAQSF